MNYYERHLGDYARDTAHLSMLEHGAYNLLLDRYYATEQPIQADQAHRLARARTREERLAVDVILSEFFVLHEGCWVHSRVDYEIQKANSRINAAKQNGTKGGRPRKQNITKEKPTGFSLGYENITKDEPNQKLSIHQTPDSIKTPHTNAQAPDGSIGWVENWEPDKKHLADQLGFRGVAMPSDAGLEQILYAFRAHYETKPMTDKQSMAKLVAWIQREYKPTNPDKPAGKTNRHAGFEDTDYSAGVLPDGRF